MGSDKKENPYYCIYCGSNLSFNLDSLTCSKCFHRYEIRGAIPILTEKERYWCNISKNKMQELNQEARDSYWVDAIEKHLNKDIIKHIYNENRLDFWYLLPSLNEKRILEIGSMWGGITVPIAKYAKEVFSVDTTYETLELLNIRKIQDKINNINIALASAHRLPFCNDYFDIVLLIGVLEWLGSDYEFDLSECYGKKRRKSYKGNNNAYKLQMNALAEIHRVLKPGGILLLAIENRFSYRYFFGYPDDHTGIPFSSLLPRPLANIYMRLLKNQDYCEYTYSYRGYRKILSYLKFNSLKFHAAIPTYRDLEVISPLDNPKYIEFYYENYALTNVRQLKRILLKILVKLKLMKYLVPSFIILAKK